MNKFKAYLITTYHSGNEFLDCGGYIVDEFGCILGQHHSSSFSFLRADLMGKENIDYDLYEIIDLIGKEVPQELIKKIYKTNNL